MASNKSNALFQAATEKFAYDEFMYGRNEIDARPASGYFEFAATLIPRTWVFISPGVTASVSYTDAAGVSGKVTFEDVSPLATGVIAVTNDVTASINWRTIAEGGPATLSINIIRDAIRTLQSGSGPNVISNQNAALTMRMDLTQSAFGQSGNTVIALSDWLAGAAATKMDFRGGRDGRTVGTWAPTTGTVTAAGVEVYDTYTLSPFRHGHFFDVLESPPEKFYFNRLSITTPPVSTLLSTSSYRLSLNQDTNSRVFHRYLDGEVTSDVSTGSLYTELF
jgi:hypothetical protein